MARRRIKTLAGEWGVTVQDVLASCERLRLGHSPSESSLLGAEEAARVKGDLDEQAHRAEVLRRETVVETSAGKVLEKRLTATVVRRRHTEPAGPKPSLEPFQFESEEKAGEPFDGGFLETAPQGFAPEAAPESAPGAPETGARAGAPQESEAAPSLTDDAAREPARREPSVERPAAHAPAVEPPRAPAQQPSALKPAARAPSMADSQRGPKVLGRIDLRRQASIRPAAPTGRPAGAPARPAATGRFAPAPAAPVSEVPPSPESQKPGARAVKKKKVVKKDVAEFGIEREIRGLRVPKKKRALPGKEQRKTEITTPKASKRVVRITEGVTVGDLARNMGVKAGELIKKLMGLGVMATLNQMLDPDTATLVAGEFGYTVESVGFDVESALEEGVEETVGEPAPRPPVVTVMGHVDHGKTSLLDAIRKTNVTGEEFGGITQHIGAYTVTAQGKQITFVDTPGHEAFTAMRARGAKVTDIVVLVVAADEGVMPQTIEALNHARQAKVPIIVAMNKIDRPDANVDRLKQQLSEQGLIPEDYGGDTITVPLSARTGENIDKLLEMILLQAEVMELKAVPNRRARGTVVESQLDRGRGPVATVLIQEGTLHQGEPFVCGSSYGRVRAMLDHRGDRLEEAGPATPVEIFGLSEVPEPGTAFTVLTDEAKARQISEFRRSKQREGELARTSRVSLEDLSARMAAGEVKELKVIVKGDVQGSVEAVAQALNRLSTGEVKLEVIHASAGAISETDVTLAAASKALIVGFNVRSDPKAVQLAEKEGVEIRLYTIIYEAINDIHEAMEGLLAPTYREKSLGRAEVRQIFNVAGLTVAGSMVADGKITRSARARLVRDGRVVWEGKIGSLRRFKDDVREVTAGYECGIGLENYNDVKPADAIEAYEMEPVLRKLERPRSEAVRGAQSGAEKQIQT